MVWGQIATSEQQNIPRASLRPRVTRGDSARGDHSEARETDDRRVRRSEAGPSLRVRVLGLTRSVPRRRRRNAERSRLVDLSELNSIFFVSTRQTKQGGWRGQTDGRPFLLRGSGGEGDTHTRAAA